MPHIDDFTLRILTIAFLLVCICATAFQFWISNHVYQKFNEIIAEHEEILQQQEEYDEVIIKALEAVIESSCQEGIEDYETAARARNIIQKIKKPKDV